jgi:E3 ubiquitin-protein ligase BRE1
MIEMKEEAATRLMHERIRADRSIVLSQQEQAAQAERLAAADRVAEKEADLRAGLEAQVKAARDALAKLEEAQRHAVSMLDHARRAAEAAQREALQAKEELKLEQEKLQRSAGREAKAAAAAAEANATVKSLTQEREAMERKLRRNERSAAPTSVGDGGKNADYYKAMVKCPLCHLANKDTVITKCGHAFCRGCLDKRLELRNRKCPGCQQVFDKSYVRELWLEHEA